MKRVGTIIIGSFALLNVLTLFMADRFPLGDKSFGEYSIYSSAEFFYVYHIWGIVLAVVCVYAMWKEIRLLFMISLFLLCVVMFYPYFTSAQPGPQDNKPQTGQTPGEARDSVPANSEVSVPDSAVLDSIPKDS